MTAQSSNPAQTRCRVSVIIKALNEERNICGAIESSLAAIEEVGGEVILADSYSSDRTVELACRYPIRVVQLANADERCCGIGPQLGYQHARGDYVYILDGDMRLLDTFLPEALTFLALHPEVGGVGGGQVELNTHSMEFRERALRAAPHWSPGEVDRLDCGGLYRRRAIAEVGYFSDRNLHSYEEFDLGVRLRARGWKLWRLPVNAATHYGHDSPPYSLLKRRWTARYSDGLGELVRGAISQPHMQLVLRDMRELRLYGSVLAWWGVLLTVPFWPLPPAVRLAALVALACAPLVIMTWRKRSVKRALYSVASWCLHSAGMVRGLLRARVSPSSPVASRVIHEPPQASEAPRERYA